MKLHYIKTRSEITEMWCGRKSNNLTYTARAEEVTCKTCKRSMLAHLRAGLELRWPKRRPR